MKSNGILTLVSNRLNYSDSTYPGSIVHGMNLDLEMQKSSSGF